MLKKILLGLLVLVLVFVAFAYTRPAAFEVTRSKTMMAPPDVVYAELVDFHRWPRWSPWEQRDPAMKREYSGPKAGKGAVYSWAGNSDVGEGRMTITDTRPAEQIVIQLDFTEPMAASNITEFKLAPSGQGGSNVTWTMSGNHNFVGKAMTIFMSMDKMVGNDFEAGLAKLDSVTTAPRSGSTAPLPTGSALPAGG
jgi:uncharacterized protein YndB with AHSA1/START domain